ncbi:MAG TPA: ABC transporter ATP-binding protein [Gammaproteobacteria bacterium]|nr:multidrug transporter [Acidiferrobacteraceae bacterium]HCF73502.1 ABC transporter ATP-binding protein [Gammaproteobacteria bacterium]|tara:strand:- start:11169 stop:13955 length:2787 start_codon:yes stop_codon:yes gene_type:complete
MVNLDGIGRLGRLWYKCRIIALHGCFSGPFCFKIKPLGKTMERSIYKYILKHTLRGQLFLLLLSGISMPLVYLGLMVPKEIINKAIGGQNIPDAIFGFEVDQVSYLLVLCAIFLLLVIINGGLKFYINVYKGVLGERMLRRFRYDLYSRLLRFPLPHFKRTSQGQLIPMITAETEPLGGFIGDAIGAPAFQGALLFTYLFFIFQQDVWLGLAAIVLYPPQMWLIPRLQSKVNLLSRQRVQTVRGLSDQIGETVMGIADIHANDTSRYERARAGSRLGRIFDIRVDIYRRKFFIKFLNNFLAQITPFFFYSIGGYLVIQGDVTIGALVAVLAAYKDIGPPWKELLKFYQVLADIRVKYESVTGQFQPANMLDEKLQESEEPVTPLAGQIVSSNVVYSEDEQVRSVDGASFKLEFNQHASVVGASGSGKSDLAELISRLLFPTGGRLNLNETSFVDLPESVTGRRLSYVGPTAHVFTGTIVDNLYYGLKHEPRPAGEDEQISEAHKNTQHEAQASANSMDDPEADWLDYESAGVKESDELLNKAIDMLSICGLEPDVYEFGLGTACESGVSDEVAAQILEARQRLFAILSERGMENLVERFEVERYNVNVTVAENLLFGAPLAAEFRPESLPSNATVMGVLKKSDLYQDFLHMGYRVAETMCEIFADVPPESELFEQYSLVSADDLPVFEGILKKISSSGDGSIDRHQEGQDDGLDDEERALLLALPFKLIPARHRLGIIDDEMQQKLLRARHNLREELGEETDKVTFLDIEKFNTALTVRGNILFGALVYGQATAREKVSEIVDEVIEEIGMRKSILALGMDYHVGSSGARLGLAQKQKLALARALLKQPDMLIVNEAVGSLDPTAQTKVVQDVTRFMAGRGVAWVVERPDLASEFEQVLVMDGGRITQQGSYAELSGTPGAFKQMLEQ